MLDVDFDVIVNVIMGGVFGFVGECCMVLLVVVVVGDEIVDKLIVCLKLLVEVLKVGLGCMCGQEENEMGLVVFDIYQKKVFGYIDKGESEGVKLVVDGCKLCVLGYDVGYYVGGIFFDYVILEMIIWCEEIFGLVLGIVCVVDYDSVFELVNSYEFGNGSVVFISNGYIVCEFVYDVQVGMVGVNVLVLVLMVFYSFGGWKCLVFGVLNVYGLDGVCFYMCMKIVIVCWLVGQQIVFEFSMLMLG